MNESSQLIKLALAFGGLSLVSVGGAPAMLPEIHRIAVDLNDWQSNAGFARDFALTQLAPGPNFLIISLVGWRAAGFPGLLAATLAAIVPSSALAILVGRLYRRFSKEAWFYILKESFPPIVLGLMLSSGFVTARAAVSNVVTFIVVIMSAAIIGSTRRNPLFAMIMGATVGLLAGRLGLL
jgi:chromate transporter